MDFNGLAQHIYGPRDHHEIVVANEASNGGINFGTADFSNFSVIEIIVITKQSGHSSRLRHWSIRALTRH